MCSSKLVFSIFMRVTIDPSYKDLVISSEWKHVFRDTCKSELFGGSSVIVISYFNIKFPPRMNVGQFNWTTLIYMHISSYLIIIIILCTISLTIVLHYIVIFTSLIAIISRIKHTRTHTCESCLTFRIFWDSSLLGK